MPMKARTLIAILALNVLCLAQETNSRFSEDEIAVYRAYLATLPRFSVPLAFSARIWDMRGVGAQDCLARFNIKIPPTEIREERSLSKELATGVEFLSPEEERPRANKDRELGILDGGDSRSLSSIAFDKDHHYAAMGYFFGCGATCGEGKLLIFEKVQGRWRQTEHTCGQLIA